MGKFIGRKIVSTILVFSLVFNSLIPIHISYAEENLPIETVSVGETPPLNNEEPTLTPPTSSEATPTPAPVASDATPTEQPSITPSPTITDTIPPTPTPTNTIEPSPSLQIIPSNTPESNTTPTPSLTTTPTPSIAPNDTPAPIPSLATLLTPTLEPEPVSKPTSTPSIWINNNEAYATEIVKLGVTYKFPPNEKVSLTFTKLPPESGTITVIEHDAPAAINNPGSKDYEITSTMPNGSFEFNLTLPTNDPNKNVLSSQDGQNYSLLPNEKVVTEDVATVKGISHLTHFLVGGDPQDTEHPVINEFYSATSNDWVELYNPTQSSVNLAGWELKDSISTTKVLSGTIPANGFLVFTWNVLNQGGDTVSLYNGSTLKDQVVYPGTVAVPGSGQSARRTTNGGSAWEITSNITQGYTNENSTVYVDDSNTSGNEYGTQTYPFNTIQEGINAVAANGTVNVVAGTYTESLAINKSVILQGAGSSSTTIIGAQTITANNVTVDSFTLNGGIILNDASNSISGVTISHNFITGAQYGIRIGSTATGVGVNNVTIDGNTITANTKRGILFYNRADYVAQGVSNVTINGNEITNNTDGGNQGGGISTYGPGPNTITNNTVSNNNGNGISIKYDNGDVISGNTITGNVAMGINMHQVTSSTIELNTVSAHISEGVVTTFWGGSVTAGKGSAIYIHEDSHGNIIRLNTLMNNKIGILINRESAGVDPTSNSINNNNIANNTYGTFNALVAPSIPVNAINNWWGSASPNWASILSGSVSYDPWYMNSGRTVLSTAVSGSTVSGAIADVQLTSATSGQADLPSGVTTVVLSNSTYMDLSASANANRAFGEGASRSIYVGGSLVNLNNFTSGTLVGANLNVAQTIGGTPVLVDKVVKLTSGTGGEITLSNSSLSGVNVSIPDSTSILAPSGWNGMMQPPKTGSSTGAAPTGFSVGNTIIEVGSADAVLLFDKPVVVTLSGVTGEVGYKPSGSTTWQRITTVCNDYNNPTNVSFPGECYVSNGTDTRIYTYHFTTFGSLTAATTTTPSTEGNGGVGGTASGGSNPPVCNDTKPGSAPTLISWVANNPNEVTLTWTKAKDPVTYYLIAYGTSSGSQQFGNPNIGGHDTTSYTVKGLSGGSTYYFKVRAGNGCMPGDYSNELVVTPFGNELTEIAEGFEAGVLGTKEEIEKNKILPTQEIEEILGEKEAIKVTTTSKIFSGRNLVYIIIVLLSSLITYTAWRKINSRK